MRTNVLICTLVLLGLALSAPAQSALTGELKKWHKITLTFDGPQVSETGDPNPFMDYRLNVTFTQGDRSYVVPGYFAADGDAANSGADSGNKWRVHFAPDAEGSWAYTASFRTGNNVAISDNASAGQATAFDGANGTFEVGPTDKSGRDNRAQGRLQYAGERYLRYAETGDYFLKIGADAPENLLAYEDFDNTPNNGNRRKSWAPHADDWNTGDPSWAGGKGTELIGAINYLAEAGQNAFSFLTMNINGDDKNVFPYISDSNSDRLRMDCSKLDQWEILFEHADQLGMYLHFKTQETENDQLLDGGSLGNQRKLYYRELIARFAHHLALNWNIGEENTNTNAQRKAFAEYFHDHDPYQHHIVIHTYPGQHDDVYSQLVGNQSEYTGASLQVGWSGVHKRTLQWINEATQTGKQWVVANDEQGNAQTGVPHDDYNGSPSQDAVRKATLWGNLMAGGAGVEYYFGYSLPHSDLTAQDFRSRSNMWTYNRIAHQFFTQYVSFWETENRNDLVGNNNDSNDNFCLAKPGDTYVVYLSDGGTTDLDFEQFTGTYSVKWFNPRTGEGPIDGSKSVLLVGDNGGNDDGGTDDGGDNGSGSGAFIEDDGIVVIEMESATNLPGSWKEAGDNLSSPNINNSGDASGDNFIVWEGSQHLNNTTNGVITYPVRINSPGTYRFEWRNQVGRGTNTTEHNDTWLKIEANAFYGEKNNGGSTVCPKGAPGSNDCSGGGPNGSGSNGFFKVYSSGANSWSWSTRTSDNDAHNIFARFDEPGTYNIVVAARSSSHVIDRMVLAKTDYNGDPRSLSLPESQRMSTGGLVAETVSIGNPPNSPNQDWVALITAEEVTCPDAGTPCNDGDPTTTNDGQDGNCNCTGESCPPAGTTCDDGNPETTNDVEDGQCNCRGTIPGATTEWWFEAECGIVGENWRIASGDNASNQEYIMPPGVTELNDPPSAGGDQIRFSFTTAQAGTYRVFARTMTPSGDGNSLWVKMDNSGWIKWNQINGTQNDNTFRWDQVGDWTGGETSDPITFNLEAGTHTLFLGRREPGIQVDKVLITEGNVEPQGLGGEATNCLTTDLDIIGKGQATLTVFPNPADQQLQLTFASAASAERPVEGQLVDGLGRVVAQWRFAEANTWREPLNLQGMAPGWYAFVLITTDGRYTKPILIQR